MRAWVGWEGRENERTWLSTEVFTASTNDDTILFYETPIDTQIGESNLGDLQNSRNSEGTLSFCHCCCFFRLGRRTHPSASSVDIPPMATKMDLYAAESSSMGELEEYQSASPLVKSVRIKVDDSPMASPSSTKMTAPSSWTDSARSNLSLRSNGSTRSGASSDYLAPALRDNLMRRQRKDRNPMV